MATARKLVPRRGGRKLSTGGKQLRPSPEQVAQTDFNVVALIPVSCREVAYSIGKWLIASYSCALA